MSYRDPIAPVPPDSDKKADILEHGPLNQCPECGSQNSSLYYWQDSPFGHTPATHPVFGKFCSEFKRLRYGFLWFKKCGLAGTHVHTRPPEV